jgi:hypothetical protein
MKQFIDSWRWITELVWGFARRLYAEVVGEDVFPDSIGATESAKPLRLLMPRESSPELKQDMLDAQKFWADPLSCLTRPPALDDDMPEFDNTWKALGFNALLTAPATEWEPWPLEGM